MDKHTPGPWVRSPASIDDEADWSPIAANAEWITMGREGETVPVAIICGQYQDDDAWRLEANAKLIAAAPDMLEALRVAERYVDAVVFNTADKKKRRNYGEALLTIQQAIAKAEGKA